MVFRLLGRPAWIPYLMTRMRLKAPWIGTLCLGLAAALAPSLVLAQSKTPPSPGLQAKVDQLAVTSEQNAQSVAKALNMMNEMKLELQGVKGHLDAAKYLTRENEKVYQDLDMRVTSLEDKIGQIHNLLKEMKANAALPPATPPVAKQSAEVDEFNGLLNLVTAQDHRTAASGFMGFVRKYPQSNLAGSAQYWVAESFFSMGDYTRAVAEYQTLAEKYPQHPRVKEGVYKQGVSFQKLKKYPEAKLFYQKVISAYPQSAEALQAQGRLSRLEALEAPSVALQMNPSPGPTPQPKSTGGPRYDKPIMKPNPYPGAKVPPGTQPPAGSPPAPANPPAAPAPEPEAPKPDTSGAPLF